MTPSPSRGHHECSPCSPQTMGIQQLPAGLSCRTLPVSIPAMLLPPARTPCATPQCRVPTVKAAPPVLVVDVLCEAVLLEQLVRGMLELGQGLRGAAIAPDSRGPLRGAGAGCERLLSAPLLGNSQERGGHTPCHLSFGPTLALSLSWVWDMSHGAVY